MSDVKFVSKTFVVSNRASAKVPDKSLDYIDVSLQGIAFNRGLFRFCDARLANMWRRVIKRTGKQKWSTLRPFAFDWEGRAYLLVENGKVVGIDPATSEIAHVCNGIEIFIDVIVSKPEALFFSDDIFEFVMSAHDFELVKYFDCIGFKDLLYLGGDESIENREITDIEIYWDFSMQLAS